MRVTIKFAKTEAMQFTGHLDLHRTLERTMRRANLPLAYSQGFNPRPRLALASALPLGYTSECEFAEFWLHQEFPLETLASKFRDATPPGIQLLEVQRAPDPLPNQPKAPMLQTLVQAAEFTVTLLAPLYDIEARLEALLARESIPRQKTRKRKVKHYDLRHLVEELVTLPVDAQGQQRLHMRLAARQGATARPDEVLEELGVNPLDTLVHRTKLILADGQLLPSK